MDDFKITLDREAFKALASDTRLEILKALDERPMTVSELSRRLDLNKATVFEHLERLTGVQLVRKEEDDERKWVYYSLTWKGRRILHPERITIALLLSTALGALLSGLVFLAHFLAPLPPPPTVGGGGSGPGTEAAGLAADAPKMRAEPPSASADPVLLWVAVALFALVALLAVVSYAFWRKARARGA